MHLTFTESLRYAIRIYFFKVEKLINYRALLLKYLRGDIFPTHFQI